ncbi:MAG: L,D-transpeptidase family protein [Actinomycetota bacterium]
MSKGKHARSSARHRRLLVVLAVIGVAGLVAGGTAFAAVRYDNSNASRLMPGVTVAGIDVGEMTRSEAVKAVKREARRTLEGELTVEAGGESWVVTASDLGLKANISGAVDRAMRANSSMGLFSRVYHRVTDEPVEREVDLGFRSRRQSIEVFVDEVVGEVTEDATDAAVTMEGDDVVFQKAVAGRTVDAKQAVAQVRRALLDRERGVRLPVEKVAPEVTEDNLGYTLLVSKAQNKLFAYKGFDVVKTYGVATGTAEFPTPSGAFEVINKVANPTWVNPAPDGWGSGLPASIGPGPGNPLGTRALYLNAPGIRIHGTYSESSIGTAASHGCIRMRIAESEQLYEIIPIGTPVYVY